MDPTTLTTFMIYNPWVEHPEVWHQAVAGHLPEAFGFSYVKRAADHLPSWPQPRKINLVVGPRQSGKSTLIWHTLSGLGPKVAYINANELALRDWCTSPAMLWSDLLEIMEQPEALFFEEVQYIDNAGVFLKGLADLHLDIPIFATGSSSFHLHDKMRESLAGRAERMLLFPFSLKEWSAEPGDVPAAIGKHAAQKKLEGMLVYGSYPEVCFSDKPEFVLNRLVEAFVIRDASDTFRIRYPAKLRKLLTLMASQIGNLANFSHLASGCGLDVKTAENYANILEESHIIRLLPPFVGGRRAEITSAPKVFFVDNGIRNLMVHQFNPLDVRADRGPLFENWLFTELLKHSQYSDTLYYWRSKAGAEVDFVRQRGTMLQAFEAKSGSLKKPGLSRSARSFIEAYSPEHFYVVNPTLSAQDALGKTKIAWITPLDLMDIL
ncbi:MAG: ATP-binding protein [Thermodesulfobacteriota bacterium]|nr:ATP-binding protein [Thermodesulfobacteriota bacterium]